MIDTLPSLLITDDDRAWRETLGRALEVSGYRTLLAADGEEALDIVQHRAVDLLLADHHMPRLDGLALLQRLQQINYHLPAILITGDSSETVLEQAKQANAIMVLPKPVALRELREAIVEALRFYR